MHFLEGKKQLLVSFKEDVHQYLNQSKLNLIIRCRFFLLFFHQEDHVNEDLLKLMFDLILRFCQDFEDLLSSDPKIGK